MSASHDAATAPSWVVRMAAMMLGTPATQAAPFAPGIGARSNGGVLLSVD
jgi:hypothetical protein